jgi:hypothetical protein
MSSSSSSDQLKNVWSNNNFTPPLVGTNTFPTKKEQFSLVDYPAYDEYSDAIKGFPSYPSYEKNINISNPSPNKQYNLINSSVGQSLTHSSLRSAAISFTPQTQFFSYQHKQQQLGNNDSNNSSRPRSGSFQSLEGGNSSLNPTASEFNPAAGRNLTQYNSANYESQQQQQQHLQQQLFFTSNSIGPSQSASPPQLSRLLNIKSGTLSSNITSNIGNPLFAGASLNNLTPASTPTPSRSLRNNINSPARSLKANFDQLAANNTNVGGNKQYSTLSFDHCESDHEMLNEKQDHMAYMFAFRTQTCEAFLRGQCHYDAVRKLT